jgi:hypothetical protein
VATIGIGRQKSTCVNDIVINVLHVQLQSRDVKAEGIMLCTSGWEARYDESGQHAKHRSDIALTISLQLILLVSECRSKLTPAAGHRDTAHLHAATAAGSVAPAIVCRGGCH